MPPNFKPYCKATLIKTVWYCQYIDAYIRTYVQVNQWNRIEGPEITSHMVNWSLTKEQKAIQWKIENIFNKWSQNNLTFRCKKENESSYRPYTLHKINSIWITDLSVK